MTTDKSFDTVIQALYEAHKAFPAMRFGQILSNAMGDASLFYTEDYSMVDLLNRYMRGLPKGKQLPTACREVTPVERAAVRSLDEAGTTTVRTHIRSHRREQ